MDDVQQAAEFIFKTYPQVTMVKYIGPAGMDIISRGSVESTKSSSIVLSKVPYDRHNLKQSINNDGTTKLLQQIEQNKNSEEQSNKKC